MKNAIMGALAMGLGLLRCVWVLIFGICGDEPNYLCWFELDLECYQKQNHIPFNYFFNCDDN